MFFEPNLARIGLAEKIPRAAAESFAAYQAGKARLKKELFDFIVAADKPGFNFFRGGRVRSLAERQAPALAALEEQAERFRRELPTSPGADLGADGAAPGAGGARRAVVAGEAGAA